MITLESIYKESSNIDDIADMPNRIIDNLKQIGVNSYRNKAVYTVLVTLIVYKINNPEQDIRYHQSKMDNGFSGRSYDTKHITPTLARLGLPSMSESGWLTRSFEQPFPYDEKYKGNISGGLKTVFLDTVKYLQNNPSKAKSMLRVLLNTVIQVVQENKVEISPLTSPENLTIDKIVKALYCQFTHKYGTHNGAKLPVLAFYSIYQCIIEEVSRYSNCKLAELSSLTACDLTSKASGDIEIFRDGALFEAVEIKLEKAIDESIVRIARDKIYKYNPERYYILSSSEINAGSIFEIEKIIDEVRENHGCQIIVNGLVPTIKYYLRLISRLDLFVENYSANIEVDRELQKIHKDTWNEILSKMLIQ